MSHEVDYNRGNDQEELGSQLASVEEIAEALGRDFSEEIGWIEDDLGRFGEPEDDDFQAGHGRRPDVTSSIEALFDSLIE